MKPPSRKFDMDIGTVVNLNIHQRDDGWYYKPCIRTCIVVGGKSYYDLQKIWTVSFEYLRECYNRDGLFLYTSTYHCPVDLQGEERHNPFCYELMFGDTRAWIRSDVLMRHCSESV